MITLVISLLVIGWVAAAVLGTQTYFLGEQTKPIHERNLNSEGFEQLAKSVTGKETNYGDRIAAYPMDAYASNNL
ncbi:MAG: hypothetical protein DSM107014_14300 [Gomphosphaeria aponina SAG 52.96 = DSM 107014]|uniref:Uncharacterized protein n=1 Tax=Gomphosphaeria aponina SAG 52.96 = DSM 107014 TaxID=1521640 RepID=A0A941JSV1_9CHRO|nr:hypothetical protein [Gomphosphaeria aponina SAG 52.96 = DSM 107014]